MSTKIAEHKEALMEFTYVVGYQMNAWRKQTAEKDELKRNLEVRTYVRTRLVQIVYAIVFRW